eukprot:4637198-Karenia_brevis.AAC.1
MMLNTKDWWDIPCNEWDNEDVFAAERAVHFVIQQVLKNDIARFERGELANDTGGSGPKGSKWVAAQVEIHQVVDMV